MADDLCALIIIAEICCEKEKKVNKKNKIWMKEWLKKRNELSNTKAVCQMR